MTEQDRIVIEAMRKFGGSFAAALALACMKADENNLQRIKDAFPDMWERYTEVANHYVHASE